MEEKLTQKNVIEKWASKFPEVTRWLTKLQKKEASALNFYRFCEWAHKTPTELLALREVIFLEFQTLSSITLMSLRTLGCS